MQLVESGAGRLEGGRVLFDAFQPIQRQATASQIPERAQSQALEEYSDGGSPVTLQRLQQAPEPMTASFGQGSSSTSGSSPDGAGSPGGSSDEPGSSGQDPFAGMHMQEIASRLYPYISARIKSELRLDRERHGVLTPWHR